MAFMDETWIWRFHCKKKGIGPADALINGSKTRKGKRLIVIDAMTADGQLSHWDEDGILQSTAHQNWEYAEDGDYHEAMDHNHFRSWVEDFFIPTFETKYSDKKCILILDNAPYHVFEHFNPMSSAMTKSVLVKKLREMNIESITCDRGEKGEISFEINDDFKLPSHPKGPSVIELQKFTLKCMKENDDKDFYCWLEKHWQIIFTPP